jgi:chromosome segregation ATPase
MATESKALVDAVERLLNEVNEGCDRAMRTCSKLDQLQKGSLDYEDGLDELADELESITAKLETLCEALQAFEKPRPEGPPPPQRPM